MSDGDASSTEPESDSADEPVQEESVSKDERPVGRHDVKDGSRAIVSGSFSSPAAASVMAVAMEGSMAVEATVPAPFSVAALSGMFAARPQVAAEPEAEAPQAAAGVAVAGQESSSFGIFGRLVTAAGTLFSSQPQRQRLSPSPQPSSSSLPTLQLDDVAPATGADAPASGSASGEKADGEAGSEAEVLAAGEPHRRRRPERAAAARAKSFVQTAGREEAEEDERLPQESVTTTAAAAPSASEPEGGRGRDLSGLAKGADPARAMPAAETTDATSASADAGHDDAQPPSPAIYVPVNRVYHFSCADPRGRDRVFADPGPQFNPPGLRDIVPDPPPHHLLLTTRRMPGEFDFRTAGSAETRDWVCRRCGLLSVGDRAAAQHATCCDGRPPTL